MGCLCMLVLGMSAILGRHYKEDIDNCGVVLVCCYLDSDIVRYFGNGVNYPINHRNKPK